MSESPWYAQLRETYRPERVRLLLIGESAPSDHGRSRRRNFFYASHLGPDNLYRGVVQAVFGLTELRSASHDKIPWLRRLQDEGIFLIDLVPEPVNDIKCPDRRSRLRENVPNCVERAAAIEPEGIILCSREVFRVLSLPLRQAGLPVLHDAALSFPLGNFREIFVAGFREAYSKLP